MSQSGETEAIEAAVEAEKKVEEKKEIPDRVELSNGIVLKLRRVAPLVVREATVRVEKPRPPTVYREDKQREEENPADPDYLEAMEAYDEKTSKAAIDAILLLGTEPVEIPEGVSKPEDSDWVEVLDYLGITLNLEDPRTRYLAWLRFYAMASADDIEKAIGGPMLLSGVSESEVRESLDSFRSDGERGTNSDSKV